MKSRWMIASGVAIGLLAVGVWLGIGHGGASAKNTAASSGLFPAKPAASRLGAAPRILAHYTELPLAFEPNVTKRGPAAEFVAHGDGYTIYLNPAQATLALKEPSRQPGMLTMRLAGGRNASVLKALDELPGKSNYIIGNRPSGWHTGVPNYRRVMQRGVYPGVDLVYYGSQRQLEYDFIVSPSADSKTIRLQFQGAQSLRTNTKGDLLLEVGGDEVRLHKPLAYQEIDGERRLISASYVLRDKHSVGFQLARYDAGRPLIVDPVFSYSTYLGGSNIDGANAIAVAPDGTAFIAGGTFSADFPTAHPLQPNVGGPNDFPQDAFVAKISADGSTLLYSTYLGGKNLDVANGIAVDTFGNAYVIGTTMSPDFPVTEGSSFNVECGGDSKCGASWNPGGLIVSNGFVTKLNVAGSALVYSGFLGYYEVVRGQAIAVDDNQEAYVTGQTSGNLTPTVTITAPNTPPPPFPITGSAFQGAFGGGTTDGFVGKISATGTSILYMSYLGGSNEDVGYGIATDGSGNAYVTGLNYSGDFPVTGGALQATPAGAGDAFVAKVNTNGAGLASLVFSTYLGGSGLDQGNGIALDPSQNIYVAGTTSSSSFGFTPTAGAVQPSNKGQGDAFVAKLTSSGGLIYFTFLGGTQADAATGIAADANGDAYVTGSTVSSDFPVTSPIFQPTYGGGNADAFVTKLDPAGATLLYSSYLGGTNTDIGYGIAVDPNGSAYVAGQTCSEDFPLANPLEASPGGNCDAFASKVSTLGGIAVNPAGLVFLGQSLGTASPPQTVTVTNTDDTAAVTISSITITGDFAETNTCPASLAAGATCTIATVFQPTGPGIRKGSITITDSGAGSPQVVSLTGNTSSVTLSASNLSFGNQQVGVASNPQNVTVTNSGTTSLTISSVSANGDFSETNTCSAPLPAGTNCTITVTYKPSAVGASTGEVTIADNAPGSPQIVLLTGTGVGQSSDFTMSALPPTATVSAGQTATYTLSVSAVGGFSQAIDFSCGSLPRDVSCSFSPNPLNASGSGTSTVTVGVITGLRTAVPPSGKTPYPLGTVRDLWATGSLALGGLVLLIAITMIRRRPTAAALGFGVALLFFVAGCGSGNQSGVPAGTPAGTYQISVTGTSTGSQGPVTHTITLNLQVN